MSSNRCKSIASKRTDPSIPFNKKLIVQIVRDVEEGMCRKEACEKYGMAYSTLGEWMARLGSANYHANKKLIFSNHQRRIITRALQEGRMTKEEAHLIHKVSKKTLASWVSKSAREDSDLVCFNQNEMAAKQLNDLDPDPHKELTEARLKIKALETMIDIAEEQFKISIRKKSGAKQ